MLATIATQDLQIKTLEQQLADLSTEKVVELQNRLAEKAARCLQAEAEALELKRKVDAEALKYAVLSETSFIDRVK